MILYCYFLKFICFRMPSFKGKSNGVRMRISETVYYLFYRTIFFNVDILFNTKGLGFNSCFVNVRIDLL